MSLMFLLLLKIQLQLRYAYSRPRRLSDICLRMCLISFVFFYRIRPASTSMYHHENITFIALAIICHRTQHKSQELRFIIRPDARKKLEEKNTKRSLMKWIRGTYVLIPCIALLCATKMFFFFLFQLFTSTTQMELKTFANRSGAHLNATFIWYIFASKIKLKQDNQRKQNKKLNKMQVFIWSDHLFRIFWFFYYE